YMGKPHSEVDMNRPVNPEPNDAAGLTVGNDWLTIPNLVTLIRFLLVPVFVWLMFRDDYGNALIILVVLFSTDWIDGFLARKLKQGSTVGKWLDPLADRLSLWVVVISVAMSGLAPFWLVFALVVPDLVLAGCMALIYEGNPQMEVTILGKDRTIALMIGLTLLLVSEAPFMSSYVWHPIDVGVLAIGAGGHIIASSDYLRQGIRNADQMRQVGLQPRNKADRAEFFEAI